MRKGTIRDGGSTALKTACKQHCLQMFTKKCMHAISLQCNGGRWQIELFSPCVSKIDSGVWFGGLLMPSMVITSTSAIYFKRAFDLLIKANTEIN